MKPILQKDASVLRKAAEPLPLGRILDKETSRIIAEMKEVLDSQEDGVALAAPQIGYPLRIFVVSKRAYQAGGKPKKDASDAVYINPEITKTSQEKEVLTEGCLSVRNFFGKVLRAKKVSVRAYDEHGKVFERGGSRLMAQIFQHEIDHLNGILFTDTATDVEELDPKSHPHGK